MDWCGPAALFFLGPRPPEFYEEHTYFLARPPVHRAAQEVAKQKPTPESRPESGAGAQLNGSGSGSPRGQQEVPRPPPTQQTRITANH